MKHDWEYVLAFELRPTISIEYSIDGTFAVYSEFPSGRVEAVKFTEKNLIYEFLPYLEKHYNSLVNKEQK